MFKTRVSSVPVHLGILTNTSGGQTSYDGIKAVSWNEALTTFNHPGWHRLDKGSKNVGGPFELSQTVYEEFPSSNLNIRTFSGPSLWRGRYDGRLGLGTAPANPPVLTAQPEDYGASAYGKMKPTKPAFGSLNAIAELRELPMLIKGRFTPDIRGASNAHLAYQFGWKPLLNDIISLVELQRTAERRLNQLIRDNGRAVRRRTTVFDVSITGPETVTNLYGFRPSLPSASVGSGQTITTWQEETYKVWASARYRYFLPPGPQDIKWRRSMLASIYGLNVTPSVVYNAIPWSWLIDWFTNLGDVVENMSGDVSDRCAAEYFYVMATRTNRSFRKATGTFFDAGTGVSQGQRVAIGVASRIHKKRVPGDPFGFNTPELSLTSMQLSILGALGMSRLRP